jgi:hypothetical protein
MQPVTPKRGMRRYQNGNDQGRDTVRGDNVCHDVGVRNHAGPTEAPPASARLGLGRRFVSACLRTFGMALGLEKKTFGRRTQSVARSLGFAKPNEICHVPKAAARQRRGFRPCKPAPPQPLVRSTGPPSPRRPTSAVAELRSRQISVPCKIGLFGVSGDRRRVDA